MQKPDTPQARDEKSFFLAIEKAAAKIKEQDDFVVVHHHDADGCASGAITIKALTREGKKVQSKCLKQLYREDIPKIKALGKSFLFVDFGSGQIDYLVEEFGEDFYILDHHQPAMASGEIPFCKYHLNPLLYGINGGTELSGAGVAFFFAHALNKKNADLSVLAVVGALGDMQDYNQYSTLEGLNKKLVEIAVNEKLLEVKKDLRLYGRISRPLVSFLMFSSNPILPQITANEENSKALLAGLGIPLKDSFTEQWLTYSDLNFEQKKSLTSALIVNMIENNQPEWKVRELVGDTYTLLKENPKSPLRDGKEFATLLNACGRNKQPEVALAVCMGDKKDEYSKAIALMDEHRENLRRGIEFVQKHGIDEKKSFYFIDAGDSIDESIVGIIAGMLYGSLIAETKPIIALARNTDGTIKASGRGTSELVRRGLNLGSAMKEISKVILGVEGGGHCLHPDTLVQKQDGVISKISEINNRDFLLSRAGNCLKNASCPKIFAAKKEKIITLKTPNFKIMSSEDHLFFKYENFGIVERKAHDLKEKDFILCVKKIPFEGKDIKLLNNPFVYLKEEGLILLKKARRNSGLTMKQLIQKSKAPQKKHTILDIESFRSHRIAENCLLDLLDIFGISKRTYLQKFVERKFDCKTNLLTKEIAWLIGYIQGDGYIDKKRVECKEPDIGIISYFKKCVSRSFYLNTQIIDMQTYKKIRVYSSDLCRFFKNNFPESALLSGKLTVPKKIMMAKNEIVAQYIRGLFDADGGAHARFVYLNRIDEHLLKTVQILLLRFGILSNLRDAKVKSRPEWKSKKQYRLDITDFESLNLFAKKIGFTKKGKKHKTLKRILGKQSKKKRNSKLVSPFTYKEMKEFMAKNDIPRESLNYRLIQQRTESKRMNYETLNKYCLVPLLKNASKINSKARKKLRQINYLLGGGYLTFCEIKEKSISKNKELLIDISVPKTKNFVANGLIVHNSIAAGAKIPSEKLNEFLELLDKKIEEQLNNSKKL